MKITKLIIGFLVQRTFVLLGALLLTLGIFMLLPILQAVTGSKPPGMDLVDVSTVNLPPPPPPVEEEEEEEEPEEEPPPPQMDAEVPPLSLDQLSLALNPGFGEFMGGDFKVDLRSTSTTARQAEQLFSLADLDQEPRAIFRGSPKITSKMRRRTPGTVYIIFTVGTEGKVEEAKVQRSTDPVFERAALDAVRKWKFEPGKRAGKPVKFRMRVPITFERN